MTQLYSISETETIQILQIAGLLDEVENKKILNDALVCIKEGNSNFVVDLGKLEFMSSVGLSFLIQLMKNTQQSGGNLAIANASTQIVRLLEMTKLRPMFQLTTSVEEAVRFLLALKNGSRY
jgi:anti-sigma B factor antagonist